MREMDKNTETTETGPLTKAQLSQIARFQGVNINQNQKCFLYGLLVGSVVWLVIIVLLFINL